MRNRFLPLVESASAPRLSSRYVFPLTAIAVAVVSSSLTVASGGSTEPLPDDPAGRVAPSSSIGATSQAPLTAPGTTATTVAQTAPPGPGAPHAGGRRSAAPLEAPVSSKTRAVGQTATRPASAPPSPTSPVAPRPSSRSTGHPPPGEDTSPGHYLESTDAGNYITHPSPESAGMATTETNGPERLRFAVYLGTSEAGGTVSAHLRNVSGREMRFADGLQVLAELTRDGVTWRHFVLAHPSVLSLGPGEEVSLGTPFDFDGPGQYSSTGSVEIELV